MGGGIIYSSGIYLRVRYVPLVFAFIVSEVGGGGAQPNNMKYSGKKNVQKQ